MLLTLCSLLLLFLLVYGIQAPQLGFYWDGWMFLRRWEVGGFLNLHRYFSGERPLASVGFALNHLVNSDCRVCWHVYTVMIRFLSVTIICVSALFWIKNQTVRLIGFYASVIFVVYPAYLMNPTVIAVEHLPVGFLLFSISLSLMLISESSTRRWSHQGGWLLSGLLIPFYIGYEQQLGYEPLRLALLGWWIFQQDGWRGLVKRWYRWLFFPLITVGYLYFQIGILAAGQGGHNDPLTHDLHLGGIVTYILQQTWQVLFASWVTPIRIALVDMQQTTDQLILSVILSILATIVVAVGIRLFERHQAYSSAVDHELQPIVVVSLIGVGIAIIFSSLLPVAVFGEEIRFEWFHTTRHFWTSSIGASLIWATLIYIGVRPFGRLYVVAVLILIGSLTQTSVANHFITQWETSRLGFWQITWRSRGWDEGTFVIVTTNYPRQLSQNRVYDHDTLKLIYHPEQYDDLNYYLDEIHTIEGDPGNAYWLDQIRKSAAGELPADDPNYDLVNRLVVITPQYGTSCLHILDGERMEVPERLEEDLIRELIPYSDINRVLVQGEDVHLPTQTWGAEPPHDWCYTFQRGSLFRQAGQYEQVVALYEQAEAQGLSARDRVEWLPFIEAYTALGQYDRAYQLIRRYEDVGQRIPQAQIQSCHQQTSEDMIAVMQCIRQPSESVAGYPISMMWGEDVRLHDWQVVTGYQYQACDTLEFESVWSTDAPIDHIYSFSLILASTDGVGLINAEGAPSGVTPLWKVDVPYTDRRTITLPCDLTAGEYMLLSTMSDTATDTPIGTPQYLTTISVGNQ